MPNPEDFPKLLEAGRAANLGEPLSAFEGQTARQQVVRLILAAVTIIAGAVILFLGLRGDTRTSTGLFMPVVGGALAVIGVGVIGRALMRLAQGSRQAIVFERGLVDGRRHEPISTAAFSGAQLLDHSYTRNRGPVRTLLTLHGADGSKWKLSGQLRFRLLFGSALAAQYARIRVPELAESIANGDEVTVRGLRFGPDGVTVPSGETVPYAQLTGWQLGPGYGELRWGDSPRESATTKAFAAQDSLVVVPGLLAIFAPQLRG